MRERPHLVDRSVDFIADVGQHQAGLSVVTSLEALTRQRDSDPQRGQPLLNPIVKVLAEPLACGITGRAVDRAPATVAVRAIRRDTGRLRHSAPTAICLPRVALAAIEPNPQRRVLPLEHGDLTVRGGKFVRQSGQGRAEPFRRDENPELDRLPPDPRDVQVTRRPSTGDASRVGHARIT
jgi:hypothetical protein